MVITLGVLYLALGFLADLTALYIPERYEAKMLNLSSGKTDPEDPDFFRAQSIFNRLTAYQGLRPLPYKLSLMKMKQPNAFAFPGGGVVLTSPLLERVTSETGLAMVLGHELGHHQYRHTLRRLGRSLLQSAVFSIIFGDNEGVMELTLGAADAGHSRNQEREADEFGLKLVHEIYGNTEGALEFFEMVQKDGGAPDSQWTNFLASHPYLPGRIKRMKEIQDELARDGW